MACQSGNVEALQWADTEAPSRTTNGERDETAALVTMQKPSAMLARRRARCVCGGSGTFRKDTIARAVAHSPTTVMRAASAGDAAELHRGAHEHQVYAAPAPHLRLPAVSMLS